MVKVKRNDTYRRDFIRNNPGVFGIYFCHLCQRPMTAKGMHVDHIMPISRFGGTNLRTNLAPLCKKCNLRKSNKIDVRVPIIYTRKFLGFLVSIPLKILGKIVETFLKLGWKAKLFVVVGIAIWAYLNGYMPSGVFAK